MPDMPASKFLQGLFPHTNLIKFAPSYLSNVQNALGEQRSYSILICHECKICSVARYHADHANNV